MKVKQIIDEVSQDDVDLAIGGCHIPPSVDEIVAIVTAEIEKTHQADFENHCAKVKNGDLLNRLSRRPLTHKEEYEAETNEEYRLYGLWSELATQLVQWANELLCNKLKLGPRSLGDERYPELDSKIEKWAATLASEWTAIG